MLISDGDKLRLLVIWIYTKYPNDKYPEVQDDLIRIADRLDLMDKGVK